VLVLGALAEDNCVTETLNKSDKIHKREESQPKTSTNQHGDFILPNNL
jgi:hypothetical protein